MGNLSKILNIVSVLDETERTKWENRLKETLSVSADEDRRLSLKEMTLRVYFASEDAKQRKYIAYGAGRLAERHLDKIGCSIRFEEIWDQYTKKEAVSQIPVVRPHGLEGLYTAVIFIKDKTNRDEAEKILYEAGCNDCVSVYDLLDYTGNHNHLSVNRQMIKVVEEMASSYEVIIADEPPVLFSVMPHSLMVKGNDDIYRDITIDSNRTKQVLEDRLIFRCGNDFSNYLKAFTECTYGNEWEFYVNFEILLRKILKGKVKTKERPIRMRGDEPYDPFAAAEVIHTLVMEIAKDNYADAIKLSERLMTFSPESIPLTSVYCNMLIGNHEYEAALKCARIFMHRYPNDLLANETFYQAAVICKSQGITVEEELPEYDLSEYFCWSGISFAWCGGYDRPNDRPDFGPCFRPLQCAGHPDGEFWTSDEWKEFRKSITDGSFRYCQKNQCANIVAGWLPKKRNCKDEILQEIFRGNYDAVPKLEELHFSYDGHCNLMCPSCRLEFQTNSKEVNDELDAFYEKHLKKFVKNAKHLCLSGCGEALLSPHSNKILRSLSHMEYPELEVELRTNMTILNKRTWEGLGEGRHVIRHITASIDAAKKETFERLRYPAKWDAVYDNLKFVQSLRNSGELDMFEFHVVVQKDNIEELLDIVKLAISLDADVITFSRMVNWRNMPQDEYDAINPYWHDNDIHEKMVRQMDRIEHLRTQIEEGTCPLLKKGKKFYINIHFRPDPNDSYQEIRMGRIRIR